MDGALESCEGRRKKDEDEILEVGAAGSGSPVNEVVIDRALEWEMMMRKMKFLSR